MPANVTEALLDHGFGPVGDGEYSKLVSDLFPGELTRIVSTGGMCLSMLVLIAQVEKLVMFDVNFPVDGQPVVDLYQVFLPSSPYVRSRNLFDATAIVGIVVSGFFLLKDILVFVVNIVVWSSEAKEYVKHQVSGVIGTRTKQVVWMLSNVITNACVLVLLAGRLGIGVMSDNIVGILDQLEAAQNIPQTHAAISDLRIAFSDFFSYESFGIFVLYLLVARVIHSLSGHPRVGILTATWRSASDDVIQLSVNFFLLFLAQAVVGFVLLGKRTPLMASYGQVLLSQWQALVSGTWDDMTESMDLGIHGSDWVEILYFSVFLVTTRICLLNFFIAILIDAYMAVRKAVEKSVQSFPRDVLDTAQSDFLVKAGLLPNKQDVIALLLGLYAAEQVDIELMGKSNVFDGGIDPRKGEYLFTNKLQKFCWRYFAKYAYLRRARNEATVAETSTADLREIVAAIEVMKAIIDQLGDDRARTRKNSQNNN